MKNPALARVATSTFDRSRTKRHGRFARTICPTDSSSSAVGGCPPGRSSAARISLMLTRLPPPVGRTPRAAQSRRPGASCAFALDCDERGPPRWHAPACLSEERAGGGPLSCCTLDWISVAGGLTSVCWRAMVESMTGARYVHDTLEELGGRR